MKKTIFFLSVLITALISFSAMADSKSYIEPFTYSLISWTEDDLTQEEAEEIALSNKPYLINTQTGELIRSTESLKLVSHLIRMRNDEGVFRAWVVAYQLQQEGEFDLFAGALFINARTGNIIEYVYGISYADLMYHWVNTVEHRYQLLVNEQAAFALLFRSENSFSYEVFTDIHYISENEARILTQNALAEYFNMTQAEIKDFDYYYIGLNNYCYSEQPIWDVHLSNIYTNIQYGASACEYSILLYAETGELLEVYYIDENDIKHVLYSDLKYCKDGISRERPFVF